MGKKQHSIFFHQRLSFYPGYVEFDILRLRICFDTVQGYYLNAGLCKCPHFSFF